MKSVIKSFFHMKFYFFVFYLTCSCVQAQSFRPPAYPLITNDPYFSIWSISDKANESSTIHWTGRKHSIEAIAKIDGIEYQLIGKPVIKYKSIIKTALESKYHSRFTFESFSNPIKPNTLWKSKSIWIRRTIDIPQGFKPENLKLNLSNDDDVKVYLNGVLAYSCGPCYRSGYDLFNISPEALKSLKPGKNTMAVHCINPQGGGFIDVGLVEEIPPIKSPLLAMQTIVKTKATNTLYSFVANGTQIDVTFTTPFLMDELEILTRPVSYVTFEAKSLDQRSHEVVIKWKTSKEIATNLPSQDVKSTILRKKSSNLNIARTGTREQNILSKSGDDLRIDWGYLYVAIPKSIPTILSTEDGSLNSSMNLGKINKTGKSAHLIMAYDDLYSIQYFGKNLKAWWRRKSTMTLDKMLNQSELDYSRLMKKSKIKFKIFDKTLYEDAKKVGGDKYADLCQIAYRQAIAAHKAVDRGDGTLLFFSKENFSNGSIGTVDVTYPSAPLFLKYNTTLMKGMLEFIYEYSESGKWIKPFPAHDLGTYPLANGQTYPYDMPVEECGNMLILTAAICAKERNAQYCVKHWDILTTWVKYLEQFGFDPENQLCTDDFAGHLARNTNLSVKAIIAIGCYAKMAELSGKKDTAKHYFQIAKKMALKWQQLAKNEDHYALTFEGKNSWSQKYNLVWDNLLSLNLFPSQVKESEVKFYLTKLNKYGLPLDSRRSYTKSDWAIWTASLANSRKDFESFVNPIWDYANETESRVPLSDWHETTNAKQVGMQARSVVGGYFIKLLTFKP